ncbi:N-formylglutamate amidohydrolase [Nitratireductor basaltis]|uniref:N-formylglutamate amidohydrolase n=1 Tax=Nitratireductor basaltis TaxID=472175 RepID=A0A084U6S2_9HYPH|nr:N-formylglutamate amidohydrolase [Nitratireductor basaltis]KFB08658.1 N-formylglutamate amidohydrolase [Nitratireductor basaltis]
MTAASQFPPFEKIEGDFSSGLVLIADHAFNLLPDSYGTLGLPACEMQRHIAYDIGIEALTRALSRLTGAPAVMARFSRLLIDPNRGEDDPTLIRQLYDGTVVPGNYPLSEQERSLRLERYYQPYHQAVDELLDNVENGSGRPPLVISLHSFTPRMQGRERPWHAGILWDSDERAVKPLLEMLRSEPGLLVGDNEPYEGALAGDSMFKHCTVRGYAHALIEIRQDLISGDAGIQEWANRLAPMLDELNSRSELHESIIGPSRTGPVPGRS